MIKNNVLVNPTEAISKNSGAKMVKQIEIDNIAENKIPVKTVIGLHNWSSIAIPVNVSTMVAIELISTVSSSEPWVSWTNP